MKLRSVFKCLTITAILSQIAVYPVIAHAESSNGKKADNKTMAEEKSNTQGLLGYYFKDAQFKELAFINLGEQSKLMNKTKIDKNNQIIKSVRWMGRVKPSQTGEYILSTSSDQQIVLQINGETVINQVKMEKPLKLEKDKVYELKIEYRNTKDTSSDLQLFWSIDSKTKEQVPQKNILSPNFSEKVNLPDEKKDMLLLPNFNQFDNKTFSSELKDTDRDGIPDEWEEKGYTFRNQQIVPWDDAYSVQGYKKYVSNPYKSRTVADPYTDFEKVTGHMPAATKDEAKDPLVAAYPAVGVGMERLLFSKNQNVTEGNSGTKSKSVTDTNTTVNTIEVGGGIGFDKGFTFNFSPKYSHSWSNSTSIENTDSQSWSEEIGINTAEAAYLNANVRYYNAGTAPIYDLRPTSNFVFQNSGDSITTITAGPNQIGNSLGPGATYPQKGQAPISLDKANEAGTVNISIDKDQLDTLQSGAETLNIETTQNKGQYALLDATGNPITDTSKQWDPIRTNIDAVSGALTLNLGTGKENLERRVAARNLNDPEDRTPEITIKEAIHRAFNAKEIDGKLYYTDSNGKSICIDEAAINLIGDKKTQDDIDKQLNQLQDKKVYNAKWKRGMNITLHVPTVYYDFEAAGATKWYNITQSSGGYTGQRRGQISQNGNGFAQDELKLKPSTSYTARAYVRTASPTGGNNVVFYADSTENGDGKGARQNVKVDGDNWKMIEFSFNTGPNPEYFNKLGLKNNGSATLHFDDVSVTEWSATEELQKAHVFEKWAENTPSQNPGWIRGATFSRVPKTKVRYQWKINGNFKDIIQSPPTGSNGKRTVPVLETPGSNLELYAVDEKNDNLKVKVAEYKSLLTGHEFGSWNIVNFNGKQYVNGLYFNKVPSRNVRYKLVINGVETAIKAAYPLDSQGRRYVNFLDFNAGLGIPIGSKVQVLAVDDQSDTLRFQVALRN
ncbi:Iota toxin protein Ib [Viridibacillus sp. YIM B01967]|uniref:Iota toxin protein Ib n=1 Tax=Viridibacillus soli TaxID=2798301 RepID=A0ABS1HAG4_9BACL|nr:binary toxin-like calcium binding domain-containing protein [Viridibacillus soli]MBK3496391.1 Iota toxin protein Ib [Viridibacillus soli]